jgi:hypothetical protein
VKGIRLLHENGLFSPSGIDSGSKKNWNRKQSMKVHVVIALSHTKAFQHRPKFSHSIRRRGPISPEECVRREVQPEQVKSDREHYNRSHCAEERHHRKTLLAHIAGDQVNHHPRRYRAAP